MAVPLIEIIRDTDLPPQFQTAAFYRDFSRELIAAFKLWCQQHSVYYYAQPRDSFSVTEAFRLAGQAGCSKLLMEDMS